LQISIEHPEHGHLLAAVVRGMTLDTLEPRLAVGKRIL